MAFFNSIRTAKSKPGRFNYIVPNPPLILTFIFMLSFSYVR